MAGYDLEGARQAGVSDADIAASLAPKLNYDLDGARKAGVPDKDIVDALASKFNSTAGGAAVGNPNIEKKGRLGMRGPGNADHLLSIGGAAGFGGALGAASKEILTGAGNVIGSFPYPLTRTVGGFLKGAGQVIGAGGRAAPAAAGAISGAAGETAGQTVEAMGGGPVLAETARFVGGAISPELVNAGKWALQKVIQAPALDTERKIAKETAKLIMAKLEGAPASLSDIERKYLDDQILALRGGPKSNEPLENVGSIMGNEADRVMDSASRQQIAALQQAAGVKVPGAGRPMADVGGDLQNTINTRYKGALDQRAAEFKKTQEARDAIVANRESSGQTVDTLPEYKSLVSELQSQLTGNRAPSVAASYQKILSELSEEGKPISFQRIDDVRRKLGDAFRGKPAEGYDAIGEAAAKDLYGKVSEIQKKFAGPVQEKLLDDYAQRTAGLEKFSSKYGKKSTALDQYREDTFATDPSTLPSAYFKTKASVQALKELTGSNAKVENAALEFANRELAGKDATAVRKWMGANAEWLAETKMTQRIVDKYATRLEAAERSTKNASDFAAQAAKDASLLTRQSLPAQRAVDLIKSGDTELWGKVIPAIQQSPQAKTQMVNAVRQVVADQATAKGTGDLFARNIRPFIEGSGIGTRAEMDFIAQKLASIQEMKVPEAEKLGIAKRMILQAAGGWAASAAGRGAVWAKEKVVPE